MRRCLLLLVTALLAGCAGNVGSPSFPPAALAAASTGLAALERWESDENIEALNSAEQHLKIAFHARPDNVQLQIAYYKALYSLSYRQWRVWHTALESHFRRINPAVKAELAPPAFLEAHLLDKHASPALQETLLKRAIQQQPASARSWYFLSTLLEEQERYREALYAARRAVDLQQGNWLMTYQMGNLYDKLSWQQSCIYPLTNSTVASIKHIAAAVSLRQDQAQLRNELAIIYNRLGLYPLSLREARAAYDLEASEWNRGVLAGALLDTDNWQQAKTHYLALRDSHYHLEALQGLAMIRARENDWQAAQLLYKQSLEPGKYDLYAELIQYWLKDINQYPNTTPATWLEKPADMWQKALIDYVIHHQPVDLFSRAENACQRTEAHFYTAMAAWLQGDRKQSRHHLEKVVDLHVAYYIEYQWAKAMLASELFE